MADPIRSDGSGSGFAFRHREVQVGRGRVRISYLTCEPLERAGFINAFSTRRGGVSSLPRAALNLAYFKGDFKENVGENRRRFLKALGAHGAIITTVRQTHSTERVIVESLEQARGPQLPGDAMTSELAGVLLAIQSADCLAILVGDAQSGAFAAIHAGWRGTAGRITERTVADLLQLHGLNPRTAIAALGPTACVDCYEVGEDVIERYKKEFGYWRRLVVGFKDGGKAHLDVRAANIQQLKFCGFTDDRIHVADYCTIHQNNLFFSYRCEGQGRPSSVGRLLAVVGKRQAGTELEGPD